MPRTRSRTKKTSYILQVTCDKLAGMNERDFLAHVRETLAGDGNIMLEGQLPRVSVVKRIEEFVTVPSKEKA